MTQALQLNTQRTISVKMVKNNRARPVNVTMQAIIQNTKFMGFLSIHFSPNTLMKQYCPSSFLLCNTVVVFIGLASAFNNWSSLTSHHKEVPSYVSH
jgi:hypothetical protein